VVGPHTFPLTPSQTPPTDSGKAEGSHS